MAYEVTQVDGKNTSMITGKTWDQMNAAERNAHQVMRGTAAPTAEGQAWLDANVGGADKQTALAVAARDAAAERTTAGTFAPDATPEKIANTKLLAELATPAWESAPGSLTGGVASSGGASTGVSSRDRIDTSGLSDFFLGTTDNAQSGFSDDVWTIWNPDTNTYEQYASDPNDKFNLNPRGDYTSYYFNEFGDHVLGFKPSTYYNDDNNDMYEAPGFDNGGTSPVGGTPAGGTPSGGTPPTGTQPPTTPTGPIGDSNVGPIADWDQGQSVTGTPPPGYQGGYDWNWDDFQPGAPSLDGGGGYDPNDYAFDRYVPGQESPWGIPEVEGGNKDFYRNQFVNLLKDEQNFQGRQDQAALARQEAMDNPLEGKTADWSWINNPDGTTGLQSDPFRTPYGVSADYLNSPGFGYSTEEAKYILRPDKGSESMYVVNPAFNGGSGTSGSGSGTSGRGGRR